MQRTAAAVLVVLALAASACAGITIKPTTTLTAETANNTSAADSFQAQSNGNAAAGNISKVSIRKLLYPGSTMPIYAHLMPWWGDSGHIDIGYLSADSTQVRNQVADMMSRGLTGVIVDWYGPDATNKNLTTIYLMKEAELQNGAFKFAVQPDKGAIKACAATAGCDLTKKVISVLTYAYNTFEISPAYIRVNGRPIVPFFGLEAYTTIDWAKVKASVPGNPIFIWRNSSGFDKQYSGGSFAWVGHDSTAGLAYLDGFYTAALNHVSLFAIGSVYKGFNDTLASWSQNKTLPPQNCGQTWLSTLKEIGKYYSSTNQIDAIHLVTWNDYEEGTELETGIENCVAVSGAVSSGTLTWSIKGSQSTIDHFTVFISPDGESLMKLGDYPASQRTLDLTSFGVPSGQYYLYVKAVGQPMMTNHVSSAISYKVGAGTSTTPVPSASPTTGAVTISSPGNNATVSSPIKVVASAVAAGDRPIVTMKIYKDGTNVYSVSASSLSASISASSGTHRLTISAWDNTGALYKAIVYVTVK